MKDNVELILMGVVFIGVMFLYQCSATETAEKCKEEGGQFIYFTHGFGCIGKPGGKE